MLKNIVNTNKISNFKQIFQTWNEHYKATETQISIKTESIQHGEQEHEHLFIL